MINKKKISSESERFVAKALYYRVYRLLYMIIYLEEKWGIITNIIDWLETYL
jgi:uncharacterized protein (DUF608 family)